MNQNVICIQDLSCFGKCSLTITLPVLSSAGICVTPLPTSLLSTHTGGLGKPYLLDLGDSMREIRYHWQELSLPIQALYSGYVSHLAQIDEIAALFHQYPQALHLVDPVLGDQGHLYASLSEELIAGMRRLCQQADIITPNMTEAYALLREPYRQGPYTDAEIIRLLEELHRLTQATILLTGVWSEETELGCALFEIKGSPQILLRQRLPYHYHGTGDLFASAFLGAYLNGKSLVEACEIAMCYTAMCMEYSHDHKADERYGLMFEPLLYQYASLCGIEKNNRWRLPKVCKM